MKGLITVYGMFLHLRKFLIRQFSRLKQDTVGNPDFTNIMKRCQI